MSKFSSLHELYVDELKDLWSASQTFFDGSEYANVRSVKIYNPNLSIYGTGTPEVFWAAGQPGLVRVKSLLVEGNASRGRRVLIVKLLE